MFDPFEEQFNLPTLFREIINGDGRLEKIASDKSKFTFILGIEILNAHELIENI